LNNHAIYNMIDVLHQK